MDKQKIIEDFERALQEITLLRKHAAGGDAEAAVQLEHITHRLDKLERKAVQRLRESLEKRLGRKPTGEEIMARVQELKLEDKE
jgi:hypothetical protein